MHWLLAHPATLGVVVVVAALMVVRSVADKW